MKPPPFKYSRPAELDEVLDLLAQHGDEAKLLAGGQSLIPLLNFRLARPSILIDLNAVTGMDSIATRNGTLAIGAMVRQSAAERSSEVRSSCPLIFQALRHVAHLQIRNRGTIGGSIAHADPAAELPGVALVLDVEMVVRSVRGERLVRALEFFKGPFTTAMDSDEILVEIRFPSLIGAHTTFLELARRSGDFALAGVAAVARVEEGTRILTEVGLAAIGVGGEPVRLSEAEAAVKGKPLTLESRREAAAEASARVTPFTDVHADAEYRKDLVGVLVSRALEEVAAG